eukprot:CAMPEP_0197687030 /NCGR_PEP_ID=MMETSP1338-20131121/103411_1 /TAXON_ID=43686 ORGANISM="Pelagodinium beii, Strain RCC1491" /NCGR_SAMPLE_ID=MMETSP1338 /ASSEMBLY_ACC=CAM_ASM_000754 /LENGTH=75 /DNA_ID=CAMNT_0043269061 /DNA_START=9 /DNA_END=236 /DNA_ORIENTATION=+
MAQWPAHRLEQRWPKGQALCPATAPPNKPPVRKPQSLALEAEPAAPPTQQLRWCFGQTANLQHRVLELPLLAKPP